VGTRVGEGCVKEGELRGGGGVRVRGGGVCAGTGGFGLGCRGEEGCVRVQGG
jgi:hypothetical protein